jgi:uncharacterized protein YggE
MRKSVVAAWLALSSIIAAVPAAADGPVSVSLAPGEVLLELSPLGVATSPASGAMLEVGIWAEAATVEDVRAIVKAALDRVRAEATAAGVAQSDIRVEAFDQSADTAMMNGTSEPLNLIGGQSFGGGSAFIDVRNPASAAALQRRLSDIANVRSVWPEYKLEDDTDARRRARADALRRARADAEAYAASMNMRIVRVVRVTERVDTDSVSMSASDAALWREREAREAAEAQIRTVVVLGVDYALAPR